MGVDSTPVPPYQTMDYAQLFAKLDSNKDGRIDVKELSDALKGRGIIGEEAKKFLAKSDRDENEELDLEEFTEYMSSHEKELRLAFENLDRNKDGKIDVEEIVKSFQDLGVTIKKTEADDLLKRIDKDGTLKIDWEEWREFLLFQDGADIKDILHYWRHSTILDIGENAVVPDDFTEKELKTGLWWRQLVAGGLAGAVSRTSTAPLDRLKILLQVHGSKSNNLSIAGGFKQMLEEGGVRSLWRGNGMNVIKIAPESALKFMAYEQIKSFVREKSGKKELGVIERLCSGSLAGATSQTIIYPMEVMKTRLALRTTGQYKGMADCAMKIFKHEGAKAFYRGYLPNILGIIPYAGIDLAIYETLKKFYMTRNKNSDPNIFVLLACGATSSTCGQFASYPLALVRTRLQAQAAGGSEGAKDTMATMFSKILREDGPKGLYRGIAPNFLKVAPAVSISYVVYERSRQYLGINPK